jgi:UrcA family protein
MTSKKTLKLAVMAFAVLTASTALAAPSPQGQPVMRRVSYADLDLNRPADAQILLHRIRKAAADLCQTGDNRIEAIENFQTCFGRSVSDAVMTVGAPQVRQALETGEAAMPAAASGQ